MASNSTHPAMQAVSAAIMINLQTDTWNSCGQLIESQFEPTQREDTFDSTECPYLYPFEEFCLQDQSLNYDEDLFCKLNPRNKWCLSPCCNWKLAERMCCTSQPHSIKVTDYSIKALTFAQKCDTTQGSSDTMNEVANYGADFLSSQKN